MYSIIKKRLYNNFFIESKKNFIEDLEKLRKQLKQEQLLKAQAVNKLAEIMNRKDNTTKGKSKVSSADLRRKEKECRKLQQELTQVCCVNLSRILIVSNIFKDEINSEL